MEIREIQVFVTVAEHLSFSKAAEVLFLSPSSVSKYISLLETNLHHKLFVRNTRKIAITEFGKAFYPYARDLLEKEQAISDFLRRYTEASDRPTLRLSVDASLTQAQAGDFLLRIVAAIDGFNRQGGAYCVLRLADADVIYQQLGDNEADLVLASRSGNNLADVLSPSIEHQQLENSINYLVYSPALSGGEESCVEELITNHTNILFMTDPVPMAVTHDLIQLLGVTPRLQPCNNWSNFLLRLAAGDGLGILPDNIVSITRQCNLFSLSLEPYHIHSGLYAFWRKGMSREIGPFLDHLRSCIFE